MIKTLLCICFLFSFIGGGNAAEFNSDYEAINSIWKDQSVYKRNIANWKKIPGISYEYENYDSAYFKVSSKKLKASDSVFGKIPSFDLDKINAYELSVGIKKFVVLSGSGAGLFSVGDWTSFNFLQVLDVSRRGNPLLYSLPVNKKFSSISLGLYELSGNLNYLRVIPVKVYKNITTEYEVVVYELSKGKVFPYSKLGKNVVFKVFETNAGWQVESKSEGEYMKKNDSAERPYYMPVGI